MNTPSTRQQQVPMAHVRHLLNDVQQQGYTLEFLLEHVGVTPQQLHQDAIPAELFGELYQRIMSITQDESFGLLSTGKIPSGTFRMLCHCIINCTTLEKAIHRSGDFYEICRGAQFKPKLHQRGRNTRLIIAPLDQQPEQSLQTKLIRENPEKIIRYLSMWHRFNCWLVGADIPLTRVHLSLPAPKKTLVNMGLFNCPIKFNQTETGLIFPTRFLQHTIVQNPKTLHSFLKTAPSQLIALPRDNTSLSAQVRSLMGKDFSRALPSVEMIAQQLNVSVSTLRRRLQEEATSYQKIKDQCRKQAAIAYMNAPQLSITDVSELMGYDEPSAFFRSFKKWTGQTPGAYRRSSAYMAQLQHPLS